MTELLVDGDALVLHLTRPEKIEGLHGDLRAPLSAIQNVEVPEMPTGRLTSRSACVPWFIDVAAILGAKRTIFAVVHRDTARGPRIRFSGVECDEWIVGCAEPDAVLAGLRLSHAS